jgi:beta-lactamase superfamily II metal-dependent hydrolase
MASTKSKTKKRATKAKAAKRSTKRKAPPAPSGSGGGAASQSDIRIRMYRVGFGDCFLVTLPVGAGGAHILVDCGVHQRGDLKTMPAIVADIAQETGNRLDLVIASHAHQDHVSGFSKGKSTFSKFSVGEVWLPWTEDPNDSDATKLRKKRNALALSLEQHFAAVGITKGLAADAVANAVPNADAMGLLHSGINGGKVRYLKGGMSFSDVAGIKGLDVEILGPPTDKKFLSIMDPPVGDRFLRLDNGKAVPSNSIEPFGKEWVYKSTKAPLSARDMKDLADLLNETDGLAFTLDSVLNNTSLVTLLAFRGKKLLFPGDAQYGNWKSWMNTADGSSILGHIDYIKIAHHGSHNATPKSALDKTPDKAFAAHISTQDTPWPSIPFAKMLTELNTKASGYVRSDSIPLKSAPSAPKGPKYKKQAGFELGDFWSDYHLEL